MWSGLWLLAIAMVFFDYILQRIPRRPRIGLIAGMVLVFVVVWSANLNLDLSWPSGTLGSVFGGVGDNRNEAAAALFEMNWGAAIGSTLLITLMASCIATAVPPLLLLLLPSQSSLRLQSLIWGALRLVPTPLSALLLLTMAKPSLPLAALALGLHHSGVMGRVLIQDCLLYTSPTPRD